MGHQQKILKAFWKEKKGILTYLFVISWENVNPTVPLFWGEGVIEHTFIGSITAWFKGKVTSENKNIQLTLMMISRIPIATTKFTIFMVRKGYWSIYRVFWQSHLDACANRTTQTYGKPYVKLQHTLWLNAYSSKSNQNVCLCSRHNSKY